MTRPKLDLQISAADFLAYYWLKEELLVFCRQHALSTAGSKQELTERITVFLTTGEKLTPARQVRRPVKMPTQFTRDTVIGRNWRCSQALRAFFKQDIGSRFHFDSVMRDFIKTDGVGKNLQQAIDTWYQAQSQPRTQTDIAPQFEYNAHIRKYMQQNAGATLQEAIVAWKEKKVKRKIAT